jgi:hypothetical protein
VQSGWKTAGLVVVLAAAAAFADAQTLPGFRQMAATPRVSFFARSAASRDRADVKKTDAFLARMESELRQPLGERLEYYRYERPEDIAAQTGVYAYGLTRIGGAIVHSTAAYHPHELVHAVAGRMGDPGRFFHEGLAVVLGDEGRWGGRPVNDVLRGRVRGLDRRRLVEQFDALPAELAYCAAGSFVQHLDDTYGRPRLLEFFRGARTPSEASAAFNRVYERSFAEEFTAWRERMESTNS